MHRFFLWTNFFEDFLVSGRGPGCRGQCQTESDLELQCLGAGGHQHEPWLKEDLHLFSERKPKKHLNNTGFPATLYYHMRSVVPCTLVVFLFCCHQCCFLIVAVGGWCVCGFVLNCFHADLETSTCFWTKILSSALQKTTQFTQNQNNSAFTLRKPNTSLQPNSVEKNHQGRPPWSARSCVLVELVRKFGFSSDFRFQRSSDHQSVWLTNHVCSQSYISDR